MEKGETNSLNVHRCGLTMYTIVSISLKVLMCHSLPAIMIITINVKHLVSFDTEYTVIKVSNLGRSVGRSVQVSCHL